MTAQHRASPNRSFRRGALASAVAVLVVLVGFALVSPNADAGRPAPAAAAVDPAANAQSALADCLKWQSVHPGDHTSTVAKAAATCVLLQRAIIDAYRTAPPTTAPPTSAPPTSAPPTTTSPTTRPPTTAPPTITPPTTAPPTTLPPTTIPPTTTAPPTTLPPSTLPPSTGPPTTTPPAPLTHCIDLPSACGYPDITNTGVPVGVQLTPHGDLRITAAGVYEGLDVTGCVSVEASNVTIRNSRIVGGCDPLIAVRPFDHEVVGTVLDHDDIVSTSLGANAIAFRSYTMIGSHIQTHGDCGRVDGNVTIRDTFAEIVRGLPPDGSHYDCWDSEGSNTPVLIDHNTIINPYVQTSAVTLLGSNFTLTNNLMSGSEQWNLYCGGSTFPHGLPYVVTGNRFTGTTNPNNVAAFCEGVTWSGNVRDDTGAPV